MTKWGIGLKVTLLSLTAALLSLALSYWMSPFFEYPLLPALIRDTASILLMAVGTVFWISSVIMVMTAFRNNRLCTTGPYSLCRHPVYSSWMLFLYPGISLLFNTWLLLSASLVIYLTLCSTVAAEDKYLEEQFGEDYANYRERVPAVIPLGRLGRKVH